MGVGETKRKPRVLVAKVGLDGHSRGAYVVAHGLRQAGIEVIYTGLRQIPAAVAAAAVQEDVDVIGVSSMVGAHHAVARKLARELESRNATDIPVIMGGIIPEEDHDALHAMGVARIFPPGARVDEIAQYVYSIMEGPMWIPEVEGSLTGGRIDELRLMGTRCGRCGRVFFPSRRNCPRCLDEKVEQVPLSDKGALETFAVATVAPPGYQVPHAQGYVELDGNGPRIFTLLADCGDGSGLEIGARMSMKIVKLGQGKDGKERVGYRFAPEA